MTTTAKVLLSILAFHALYCAAMWFLVK